MFYVLAFRLFCKKDLIPIKEYCRLVKDSLTASF